MASNTKNSLFSKDYTFFVKGIAVLMLLAHHLFYVKYHVPFKSFGLTPKLLPCLTKACVAVFTVLSGYGLTVSYKSKNLCGVKANARFVFLHIKNLLINFWWIYIPVFVLSFWFNANGTPVEIYGTGARGVLTGLLDFFGLRGVFYRHTLCQAWWYIGVILVCYLLYPLIYRVSHKLPVLAVAVTAVPCIIRIFYRLFHTNSNREVFYLLPFVIGVVFADRCVLNRAVGYSEKHRIKSLLFSGVFLLLGMAVATQNLLLGNTVYACAIILFCIAVKAFKLKTLNRVFEIFGRYSMNIYFSHVFLYSVKIFPAIGGRIQGISHPLLRYLVLAVLCLAVAILTEKIKKLCRFVSGKAAAKLKKQSKSVS